MYVELTLIPKIEKWPIQFSSTLCIVSIVRSCSVGYSASAGCDTACSRRLGYWNWWRAIILWWWTIRVSPHLFLLWGVLLGVLTSLGGFQRFWPAVQLEQCIQFLLVQDSKLALLSLQEDHSFGTMRRMFYSPGLYLPTLILVSQVGARWACRGFSWAFWGRTSWTLKSPGHGKKSSSC